MRLCVGCFKCTFEPQRHAQTSGTLINIICGCRDGVLERYTWIPSSLITFEKRAPFFFSVLEDRISRISCAATRAHPPLHAPHMPAIVLPTKTSQNPLCPNTQDGTVHEVRVFSGAGGDRLAYTCTCGLTWNQKRHDLLFEGEDPGLQLSNRAALGGTKRSSRDYQCRTCGVPKKGHVCPNSKKKAKITTPPPPPETDAVVLPASTPLMREQYEDILEFSTPPTDTQVLAFLRKYDLRPSEATDVYKNMESYFKAADKPYSLTTHVRTRPVDFPPQHPPA